MQATSRKWPQRDQRDMSCPSLSFLTFVQNVNMMAGDDIVEPGSLGRWALFVFSQVTVKETYLVLVSVFDKPAAPQNPPWSPQRRIMVLLAVKRAGGVTSRHVLSHSLKNSKSQLLCWVEIWRGKSAWLWFLWIPGDFRTHEFKDKNNFKLEPSTDVWERTISVFFSPLRIKCWHCQRGCNGAILTEKCRNSRRTCESMY